MKNPGNYSGRVCTLAVPAMRKWKQLVTMKVLNSYKYNERRRHRFGK